MAEARSAVSYRVEKANLLFQITSDEIILHINKNLFPDTLTKMQRNVIRSFYRSRNALLNAFYPAPPIQWGLLVTAPAALMLSFPPGAGSGSEHEEELSIMIRLLKPISETLWGLEQFLPSGVVSHPLVSSITSSTVAKAAIISSSVGTGFILSVSYLRRFLLSSLLTYQGWIYDEPKQRNIKTTIWGVRSLSLSFLLSLSPSSSILLPLNVVVCVWQ